MWAEYVTAETVESRIWPRAAVFAERMWSPAEVTDVAEMYRRMDIVSQRLEFAGLRHRSQSRMMLQRVAGYQPLEALEVLADAVEPLGIGGRSRATKYTSATPFNRFVDAVIPDNPRGRQFARLVDGFLADPRRAANREAIEARLGEWRSQQAALQPLLSGSVLLQELEPLSKDLAEVAAIGLFAIRALVEGVPNDPAPQLAVLDGAARPRAEVTLAIVPAVRKLVEATGRPAEK